MSSKKDEQKNILEMLDHIVAHMATKDDIAGLNSRMDNLETRMGDLETRIDNLKTRMDNLDVRMGGLETRVGDLENRMDTQTGKINEIYNLLDASVAKEQEDEIERASLAYKVDRHEKWIHTLAENTNTELVDA